MKSKSPFKQTEYAYQEPAKGRKNIKARLKQYKDKPYQRAVDKFPQFNQATDTIMVSTSPNYNIRKSMNNLKAQKAAINLYDGGKSGKYMINNMASPQDEGTYQDHEGNITNYQLYNKEELKSKVSPAKQTKKTKKKHPDQIQGHVFRGPKDVPTVPYTQAQIDTMSQKSYDKLPMFFKTLDESKKADTIVNKVKGKKQATPLKKKDACYHKAKRKYDVFPSAYASGYIAKCRKRKGNIG